MMFKTAVLALALAAPAAAKGKAVARELQNYIDLDVSWSVDKVTWYMTGVPEIKDIPCGESASLYFKVTNNLDEENVKLTTTVNDHGDDYGLGDIADGMVYEQDEFFDQPDGTALIELTFTCGEANPNFGKPEFPDAEDTCTLDMDHQTQDITNFDGEKSSFAVFKAAFKAIGGGAEIETEQQAFKIGCETAPVVLDDPHFRTWNNRWYDYMGECDLTFVDAPNFSEDAAMRINIRTKARYDYSFIESAVIQIGDDVMEVGAWGEYFINGVEGARLPKTLAGYQVTRVVESEKVTRTYVHIADDETIEFKTYKDWVSVMFHGPSHSRYMGSSGMLGSHDHNGKLLGRDGKTLFTDMEAFGQEWQVQGDEEMLFHSARLPQAPEKCILPAPAQEQRRLGESLAAEAAEAACRKAGWSVNTIEMCIHDVMATGDLELASAGAM